MRFRVTAKGIINVDDRVLLVRKRDGAWDLPGGRLNPGENLKSALIREAREEIGVGVDIGDLVHIAVRVKRCRPRFFFIYMCSCHAPLADITLSEEHVEARLFTTSQVERLDMKGRYKKSVRKGAARIRHRRVRQDNDP